MLLLCDLDDTLIDRAGAFRRWATAFLEERGLFEEGLVAWMEGLDERGVAPREMLFEAMRQRLGLPDPVDRLVGEYRRCQPTHVAPLDPAVRGGLVRLRTAGWRLGVVTNGAPFQIVKMERAGLLDLVDGHCISSEVGLHKPDPEIFRLAAERCGSDLGRSVMIGDSGPADIGGAVACGIPSIWIHHGRSWEEMGYRPTRIAGSMREALDQVASLMHNS